MLFLCLNFCPLCALLVPVHKPDIWDIVKCLVNINTHLDKQNIHMTDLLRFKAATILLIESCTFVQFWRLLDSIELIRLNNSIDFYKTLAFHSISIGYREPFVPTFVPPDNRPHINAHTKPKNTLDWPLGFFLLVFFKLPPNLIIQPISLKPLKTMKTLTAAL